MKMPFSIRTASLASFALLSAYTSSVLAVEYMFYNISYTDWYRVSARNINDSGQIIGNRVLSGENVVNSHGYITTVADLTAADAIDYPGADPGTVLYGINNDGDIVGRRALLGGSFVLSSGAFTDIAISDPYYDYTEVYAINDAGNIGGTLSHWDPRDNVAYIASNAEFASYDLLAIPGADNISNAVSGLNDSGQAVGHFHRTGDPFTYSAFLYEVTGVYFEIEIPDATRRIEAEDINDAGDIVGSVDSVNIYSGYGFLYTGGAFYEVMYPDSTSSRVYGIDNLGRMVGSYYDSTAGTYFGFLAIPVAEGQGGVELPMIEGSISRIPEPATVALFGLGLAGIPFVRRRRTPA